MIFFDTTQKVKLMAKYNILSTCILLSFLTLFSCKKDRVEPSIDLGVSYFPIETGNFIIYDVDSSFYDDFYIPTKIKNTRFLLKEKVQSLFYDNQNKLAARIERFVKHYDSTTSYDDIPWTLKNVWTMNATATSAERVEENVRFVKLVFPVALNKSWDSNNKNIYDNRLFSYKKVHQNESIGLIAFDSVLTTEYNDGNDILTQREYYEEKYAKNVGLIYKRAIHVQSQPSPNSTTEQLQLFYAKPLMERISSGYQYTWRILSFGKEL